MKKSIALASFGLTMSLFLFNLTHSVSFEDITIQVEGGFHNYKLSAEIDEFKKAIPEDKKKWNSLVKQVNDANRAYIDQAKIVKNYPKSKKAEKLKETLLAKTDKFSQALKPFIGPQIKKIKAEREALDKEAEPFKKQHKELMSQFSKMKVSDKRSEAVLIESEKWENKINKIRGKKYKLRREMEEIKNNFIKSKDSPKELKILDAEILDGSGKYRVLSSEIARLITKETKRQSNKYSELARKLDKLFMKMGGGY